MPIRSRPELDNLVPCFHGGVSLSEIATLGRGDSAQAIIDFSVNTNPLGPSPLVREALAAVDIQRYPDGEASLLRRELAQRLSLASEHLVVGNGSIELIWLACTAFLRSGDSVLILGPTFGEYETASRIFGARPETYLSPEERNFEPDVNAVARWAAELRPRLVFICNPNNPTGRVLSREAIELIAETASDSLVIIDEAYAALADSYWPSVDLIRRQNVLLLRSLTKDCALAGLRVGYAAGDPAIIRALRLVQPPWSVNAFAQAAALAALSDCNHLEHSVLAIGRAKRMLIGSLQELGLTVIPSSANFLLVKVGDGARFRAKLMSLGYCVRDCSSFGLPAYIRIGIRSESECQALVAAIKSVMQKDGKEVIRIDEQQ